MCWLTKSELKRKRSPERAAFSLAARSADQRFFWGENCLWQFARESSGGNWLPTVKFRARGTWELRNWSSFMTTSFCRICRFDPKISRHKDFFALRSSPFAILQIETATSILCFIGSIQVETPSVVCSICSSSNFFLSSISARLSWYSSRSTSPSR